MRRAGQVPRLRLVAKGRPSSFRLQLKSLARVKVSKGVEGSIGGSCAMDLRSLVAGWHDGENWLGPWLRDSLQGEREKKKDDSQVGVGGGRKVVD